MSPSASTSGWPGSVRSGSTAIRPARSSSAPVSSAELRRPGPTRRRRRPRSRCAPAMRSVAAVGRLDRDRVARRCRRPCRPSSGVTPSRSSERGRLARQRRREAREHAVGRLDEQDARRRAGRSSGSRAAACRGRARRSARPSRRRSARRRRRRTSARPARRSASVSSSAASNALRMRPRIASALSSDFTSGARSRHSSWPKYE